MRLYSASMVSVRDVLVVGSVMGYLKTALADTWIARQASSTSSASVTSSATDSSSTVPTTSGTSSVSSVSNVSSISATASPSTTSAASQTAASTSATDVTVLSGTDQPDLVTTSLASSTASSLSPTATPGSISHPCTFDQVGQFPPFCLPVNGTDKYPGNNYYITWDVGQFSNGSIVTVNLDYINATGAAPQNAWTSPPTPKNYGYTIITMDGDWLQGQARNNLTFEIVALDPSVDAKAAILPGPTISLTNEPVTHLPGPPPTTINKLGLEIGIPLGLAFFVLILCGLWFGMRHHRKIAVGNIMGRKKGYGVGKSRRQRMGNKDIRLQQRNAGSDPMFRDDPRDLELEESETWNDAAMHGNAFRDEIARQQTGR